MQVLEKKIFGKTKLIIFFKKKFDDDSLKKENTNLKDQRWRFRLWIADNVEQLDNIGAAAQVLKDLDLTTNLLLLDRL